MKTGCKKYRELIQKSISGELTPAEKEELALHLKTCAECDELAAMHQEMQNLAKPVDVLLPNEEQFCRMRKNVIHEIERRKSLFSSILDLFRRIFVLPRFEFTPARALAAGVVLILAGYGFARIFQQTQPIGPAPLLAGIRQVALQNQTLAEVDKSPYLLTNVRIRPEESGKIQVRFNVTSEVEYSGNLDDPLVKEVITQALINFSSDGGRLDAVALSEKICDPKITEALIFAMQHDENPAVRMKALDILGQAPLGENAQAAVIQLLKDETQVNIRLRALEVLANSKSRIQNLDTILKNQIEKDANPSVKIQAADFLQEIERR